MTLEEAIAKIIEMRDEAVKHKNLATRRRDRFIYNVNAAREIAFADALALLARVEGRHGRHPHSGSESVASL
jgi:hypothetical protein